MKPQKILLRLNTVVLLHFFKKQNKTFATTYNHILLQSVAFACLEIVSFFVVGGISGLYEITNGGLISITATIVIPQKWNKQKNVRVN